MAHFAELDINNTVLRVIVVENSNILDSEGVEQESIGIEYCQALLGGNWKQTSFNNNFRTRFAGIGYTYNTELDAFIQPKPYNSWILDTETKNWVAPIPAPPGEYVWDEEIGNWI